jgi:hypothetical protein
MIIAKYFSKPVITILPKDSHHRKSDIRFDEILIDDRIHPFLYAVSDLIVEDVQASISWIQTYQSHPKDKKIKDIAIIDEAIAGYLAFTHRKDI